MEILPRLPKACREWCIRWGGQWSWEEHRSGRGCYRRRRQVQISRYKRRGCSSGCWAASKVNIGVDPPSNASTDPHPPHYYPAHLEPRPNPIRTAARLPPRAGPGRVNQRAAPPRAGAESVSATPAGATVRIRGLSCLLRGAGLAGFSVRLLTATPGGGSFPLRTLRRRGPSRPPGCLYRSGIVAR